MELKLVRQGGSSSCRYRSNRTFMELKLHSDGETSNGTSEF